MGMRIKMLAGLCAACVATTALAGGPEFESQAPTGIDMTGIHLGVGFGYKSYRYTQREVDLSGVNFLTDQASPQIEKMTPLGEAGYTCSCDNWLIGVKGYYQYDNQRTQANFVNLVVQTRLASHFAVMLFGGLKLNEANAVYLEAGYTMLMGKLFIAPRLSPGGQVPGTLNFNVSGGVAGVGYRHYFETNVFVDLSYDYALYSDSKKVLNLPGWGANGPGSVTAVKRLEINGVNLTVNYLFNV